MCDGERRRGSPKLLKSALQARVRARFGLGARARDGELILGFGGRGEGRTGARGGEEWNGSDGELKRAEQRERGGGKGLETLLTTTWSSGVAWPTRIGGGTADRRRHRALGLQWRLRLGFRVGGGGAGNKEVQGASEGAIYRAKPGILGVRAKEGRGGACRT